MEWVRPDRALESLAATLQPQQRLVFEATCCGRIVRLLSDRRLSNALSLLKRLAQNDDVTGELLAIQPELRAATYDAFSERYSAEAIAEFCLDAAHLFAKSCEHAAYSVGSLFEQAFAEFSGLVVPTCAAALPPHGHALWAVRYETWATILVAYEGSGGSRADKVARKAGYWASWAEEAQQLKLLRAISIYDVAYAEPF